MTENGNGETKQRVTGHDLEQHGLKMLDVSDYQGVDVDNMPKEGEVSRVDWMKIFEVGKALSAFQDGVPEHLRGKWGIACRIAAHAYMWDMDPFFIADQTYVVNKRLGYMSQLIHALINRHAKLMHRLSCEYVGAGADRQCTVRGQFNNGDEREYTTPKLKDIKVKNSPLWANDTDQQLWYFAVRSWGRKWAPEVVGQLYTKEELEADKSLGYEDTAPGLHARLKGSAPSDEGHKAENVAAHLDEIENGKPTGAVGKPKGKRSVKETPKPAKRTSERPAKDTAPQEDSPSKVTAVAYPSSVAEYLAYARRWLKAEHDRVAIGQRWADERKLRNKLGVTAEDREPLEALMKKLLEK